MALLALLETGHELCVPAGVGYSAIADELAKCSPRTRYLNGSISSSTGTGDLVFVTVTRKQHVFETSGEVDGELGGGRLLHDRSFTTDLR